MQGLWFGVLGLRVEGFRDWGLWFRVDESFIKFEVEGKLHQVWGVWKTSAAAQSMPFPVSNLLGG
jgi:hypothetical protein